MKKNKSFLNETRLAACLLMAIAVLFFIFASITNSGFWRVFFILVMCACFVGTCAFFYKEYLEIKDRPNFFLYDRRRKKRLTKEELTFELANEGINLYLKDFVARPSFLWRGIPKALSAQLEVEPAFAPLIGYKMLHSLAMLPAQEIPEVFFSAEDRTVAFLCRAVRDGGDVKMADLIFRMKRSERERVELRAMSFFVKNKKFFEGRILHYIREHAASLYRKENNFAD